jgi:hypothetical protein
MPEGDLGGFHASHEQHQLHATIALHVAAVVLSPCTLPVLCSLKRYYAWAELS